MILTTHMELTLPPTLTNLKPTLPTLPILSIFSVQLIFYLILTFLFLFENKIICTCMRFVDRRVSGCVRIYVTSFSVFHTEQQ